MADFPVSLIFFFRFHILISDSGILLLETIIIHVTIIFKYYSITTIYVVLTFLGFISNLDCLKHAQECKKVM